MNIHFSNVNFSSNTGPNTFASRLANELTIQDNNIVGPNENYDIFLIFIEPSSKPQTNCKIIHRLDGIWFKPEEFHTKNQMIKWAYDNSHFVIWQSEFDKNMTQFHWGVQTGRVIHNGISTKDIELTHPYLCDLREKYSRIFVSSSNWHRQKRLKENIDLFLKIRKKTKDCLLILGNSPDYVIDDPDIYYCAHVPQPICMQVYRMADWMIHLAWLDHCPNVVVEALSQGCPVIATDSGGTHEIVRQNGLIIPENRPYNFELVNYDDPYELKLPSLDLSRPSVFVDYLDIKVVAAKYLETFENLLKT